MVLVYKILSLFDDLKLKNDNLIGFRTDRCIAHLSYHTGLMSIQTC